MPEIDETTLQNLVQTNRFVHTALQNPETRKLLLQADKKLNPNKAIPEIDAPDAALAPVNDALKKINDRLDAQEKKEAEEATKRTREAFEAKWLKGREAVRSKGYTDEGVKALEEFMEKNGVADHEIALSHFEKENPPPAAADTTLNAWNIFNQPKVGEFDMKGLIDNPDRWAAQQINETLGRKVA